MGKSIWGRVTGPATTLIATTRRLKWTWLNPITVRDDNGRSLIFGIDSPKDFSTAVRASVKRWRQRRIAAVFSQMIPTHKDVQTPTSTPSTVIDLFGVISPMVKGKAATKKFETTWSNNLGPALGSAANGGQWTQLRKSKVKKWMITDNRCQLCFADVGTTMHRFHCTATEAQRCHNKPPKAAQLAETKLSIDRINLLKTRGAAAAKVPAIAVRNNGAFEWTLNPFEKLFTEEQN